MSLRNAPLGPLSSLLLKSPSNAMPRQPRLSLRSWLGEQGREVEGPLRLPHQQLLSSGRAALRYALAALALPAQARVLVPSYHCPTLIAPVHQQGLKPRFYGIDRQGLPLIESLDPQAAALIVPHLFGIGRSLARVRAWCDQHRVPLIEDCAHTLWGEAGEREVGQWGDLATASLTKFLPLYRAGLLASAANPLTAPVLRRPGLRAQARGLYHLLPHHRPLPGPHTPGAIPDAAALYAASDMGSTDEAPLWLDAWLARHLPCADSQAVRRRNFDTFAAGLQHLPGIRALHPDLATPVAPYAFPLWVDAPEDLYQHLRLQGVAVFRWDRIWPGLPKIEGDQGPNWSRHVLQLLCHQSLSEPNISHAVSMIRAHTSQ